jgi:hypothetical protein
VAGPHSERGHPDLPHHAHRQVLRGPPRGPLVAAGDAAQPRLVPPRDDLFTLGDAMRDADVEQEDGLGRAVIHGTRVHVAVVWEQGDHQLRIQLLGGGPLGKETTSSVQDQQVSFVIKPSPPTCGSRPTS